MWRILLLHLNILQFVYLLYDYTAWGWATSTSIWWCSYS